MNITKETITKNTKTYEAGFSVSETNIGLTIIDKSNLRMLNAQFSNHEIAVIINFFAKHIGLKRYDGTVKRQGEKIEDLTNRNEELRTQLADLTEKAKGIFEDYESGNTLDASTMMALLFEVQKSEVTIENNNQ